MISKSPNTDALHSKLYGDWERCYHAMHTLAVKIEYELYDKRREIDKMNEEMEELRSELEKEKRRNCDY